eukprot:Sspe_Gene.7014::Locus_2357_Transcript_1_2_Confidence_0.750_Length_527::g.7014::m.7014
MEKKKAAAASGKTQPKKTSPEEEKHQMFTKKVEALKKAKEYRGWHVPQRTEKPEEGHERLEENAARGTLQIQKKTPVMKQPRKFVPKTGKQLLPVIVRNRTQSHHL